MGMDTVEIVLWAEDEFGVAMPDEEVGDIYTVGEFASYIATKVSAKTGNHTTYEDTLPKIIDILVQDYGAQRNNIQLSSRFIEDIGLD